MTFDQRQPDCWKGSCQAKWPIVLVTAQFFLLAIITTLAPEAIWGFISVLVVAPLALAFRRLDVTVRATGVTVAYGLRGWPYQHIGLADIVGARVEWVGWRSSGGLGYRGSLRLFKQARILVRHGECLRLDLVGGRRLWVSINQAEGAVTALADLGVSN